MEVHLGPERARKFRVPPWSFPGAPAPGEPVSVAGRGRAEEGRATPLLPATAPVSPCYLATAFAWRRGKEGSSPGPQNRRPTQDQGRGIKSMTP